MRSLFTLILFVLCSTGAWAQSGWYMSTGVGFTRSPMRNAKFFLPDNFAFMSMNPGVLFDVKVWKLHKDHWQFGFAFETGKLFTDIPQRTEVYRNGELRSTYNHSYPSDAIVSPNAVPALFVHYQQNLGKKFCLHGGVMGGMITGGNDVDLAKNITAPIGGLDLTVALAISKNVKLQLENGWRMTRISGVSGLSRTTGNVSSGNYTVHTVNDFTTRYFVHVASLMVKI